MAKRDTERVDEALDSQGPFISEHRPVGLLCRHQSFIGSVARVVIDDNDLVWLGTVRVHTLQSVECRFYAGADGNNNCGTRSRGGYGSIGHESTPRIDTIPRRRAGGAVRGRRTRGGGRGERGKRLRLDRRRGSLQRWKSLTRI